MLANMLPLLLCLGPSPQSAHDRLSQAQATHVEPPAPAVIRATGIGKPPPGKPAAQARLMARRAAEVVALRNLAAKLHGQHVVAGGDRLEARTEALIRGFRYLEPRFLDDGVVEITVELPLPTLISNHDSIASRISLLETELRDTRARLTQLTESDAAARTEIEQARARIARLEAWIQAQAAASERSASEARTLLQTGSGS